MRVSVDRARAILNGAPIDQPTIASISDDRTEPLVLLHGVGEQRAGDKLLEQLPQGQHKSLPHILRNDHVGLIDHGRGLGLKVL
jgi:hypothetical protein